MLFDIIIYATISFTLIFVVHYLYIYLQDNLTNPKIKDLVNVPEREYKHIYNILGNNPRELDSPNSDDMKNELKQYFKNINKPKSQDDYEHINKVIENKSTSFHSLKKSGNQNDSMESHSFSNGSLSFEPI